MPAVLLVAMMANSLSGAVVIDQIAVIVGKRIVKASDIERDIRITDFLNREPLVMNPQTKRTAADRLINQTLIRDEITSGGYRRATDADAAAMLEQIRQSQHGGSDLRLRQALRADGITEEELRAELLWQLTVLKFIDERFRPGVLVTDQEVRDYYNLHLAALKKENPQSSSYEALAPKIRESIEGERINQQFEAWLDEMRKQVRVQYMEGAFQ